jgi:hypothetical protein
MQGKRIRFRMNRYGLDAKLLTSADHSQRDLSAIGNQNFLKHVSAPIRWRGPPLE